MKKLFFALLLALAPSIAFAQCSGVYPPYTICGNNTGASATPKAIPNSSTSAIAMVDAGSHDGTLVLAPASGGSFPPFTNNLTLEFTSPLDGPSIFQLAGTGTTYQIWDPGLNGILNPNGNSATVGVADIRKGSTYLIQFRTNNPYGTGAVFQLITPAYSAGEIDNPVTFSNLQDGGDGTSLVGTFKFYVWDTTKGAYKSEYGQVIEQLFSGAIHVDGVANQSLIQGALYYLYAIVPTSTGVTNASDIHFDFIPRYFVNGAVSSGSCQGTVTTSTLTCVGGTETGTVQTAQTISCTGCPSGAYLTNGDGDVVITSGTYNSTTGLVTLSMIRSVSFNVGEPIYIHGLTGTGAFASLNGSYTALSGSSTTITYTAATGLGAAAITGGILTDLRWQINRDTGTAVSPTTITFAPAHYFYNNVGVPIFIDGQGLKGTYLGEYYVESTTDNKAYFNRAQAQAAGRTPGNTMTNAFSTAYPIQPLAFYTDYNAPIIASTASTTPVEHGAVNVTISSGTYNSGTGVVTLTLGSSVSILAGSSIGISGITGTGAFASLGGSYLAASVSGTTVTYNATAGLGAATITGGTFNSNDRGLIMAQEWTPNNPLWITGYGSVDIAGTCGHARISIIAVWNLPTPAEQVMAEIPFCSSYANQQIPIHVLQQWPLGDGGYRLRVMYYADSGSTVTLSLGLNGLTRY